MPPSPPQFKQPPDPLWPAGPRSVPPRPLVVTGRSVKIAPAREDSSSVPSIRRPCRLYASSLLLSRRGRTLLARPVSPTPSPRSRPRLRSKLSCPGHPNPFWDCIYIAERYNHHRRSPPGEDSAQPSNHYYPAHPAVKCAHPPGALSGSVFERWPIPFPYSAATNGSCWR
jgi:hypothetical protein